MPIIYMRKMTLSLFGVLFLFLVNPMIVMAHVGGDVYSHHDGGMMGYWGGMWSLGFTGWLVTLLIITVLILLIVLLIRRIQEQDRQAKKVKKKTR